MRLFRAMTLMLVLASVLRADECQEHYSDLYIARSNIFSEQKLATYEQGETSVEVFKPDTESLLGMHPDVAKALEVANTSFVTARPDLDPHHVFKKQEKVNPRTTEYYVLKREGRVMGLGMVVDGKEMLPVEEEFPQVNFRKYSPRLVELARLGVSSEIRGGLRLIFGGMAQNLVSRYGRESIPSDLKVVLWTKVPELVSYYNGKHGFEILEDPTSLGVKDRWVFGMSAGEFVERFGNLSN